MTKIARFDFCNESPHRWEETLASFSSDGVETVCTRVYWGAHEKLPGVRDFFRSPRLKLEKFLQLVQAKKLKTRLELGFFPNPETFPAWTWGGAEREF